MTGAAAFTIGSPRNAAECLYIGVFRITPFRMSVKVNGAERPAELVRKDSDLSEFRVTLPIEAAAWTRMEVALSSAEPLRFGFAEVR
jgi:hypothetical protein